MVAICEDGIYIWKHFEGPNPKNWAGKGTEKISFSFHRFARIVKNRIFIFRICIDKTIHFWYNDYVGVFYALTQNARQTSGRIPLKPVSGFPAVSVFFSRMRGVSL